MSPAKELHRAAMVLADLAMEAERRAAELYREAAALERRAADVATGTDRGVLLASAGHLQARAARDIHALDSARPSGAQ